MKCINNPYQSHLIHLHKHSCSCTSKILLHSSNVPNILRMSTPLSMRTNAINPIPALAAAPPFVSGAGDVSVILQTGGVMLVAYLIANFVVPTILSKDFGLDRAAEDQQSNDDNV